MKSLFESLFTPQGGAVAANITADSSSPPSADPPTQSQSGVIGSSGLDPIAKQDVSVLSHLDARSTAVLAKAYEESKRIQSTFIDPDQLFVGLLSDQEIFKLLHEQFNLDIASLTRELQSKEVMGSFSGEPSLSEETKQILEESYNGAKKRGADFVTPEDILLSLFNKSLTLSDTLKLQGVEKSKIEEKLSQVSKLDASKKSFLTKYGVDLTEKAKKGELDPVTGRTTEIERLVHILLRRTKNNPIIIGEAGVGKTAIVEGLAQMMVQNQVSPDLASKRVIQLDISSIIAGAGHRGEFEERLQNVIREAMASSGQVILFIDEIHTLIGAGDTEGSLDASNIIKPYLTRGQLQIIGTTTTAEFRKYFEKDRAFERRFQPVMCDEPSEEVALEMLKVLQPKYESFHKVTFSPEAMQSSVKLSKRFIGERFLPDKAIDLLDESASEVRLDHASGKRADTVIHPTDIEKVVSRWTGIPITKLTEKESEKLLHLEELIHKSLINQSRAVAAVSEAVRRGRIGLANVNRPIASFIFLGPTGTGKTELAKVLAEIMFGRKEAMIRLDMSEYMEKHEVAKLVGAPPGYVGYEEGGQLTEAVRAKPYSIVLLDEIEKAHPDVFNILLQLLDDGRLTDNKGNTISFKNTIVIATSNIGSSLIREHLQKGAQPASNGIAHPQNGTPPPPPPAGGPTTQTPIQSGQTDATKEEFKKLSKIINDELNKFFKPEFINRFDEVVIFEPLSAENMIEIAKLVIEATRKLLKDQNIELQLSQNALKQLATEGFDPVYGARPLKRLVQRSIENPIAIYLINKSIVAGDTIVIDYSSEQDKFTFNKSQTPPPAGGPVAGGSATPPTNGQPPQNGAAPTTNGISSFAQPTPPPPPAGGPPPASTGGSQAMDDNTQSSTAEH